MATYSVAQIENLTGITAHTLRIWERRYNFIKAKRSDTNIRYYTDAQLRQLLNISVLVQHGIRVSAIDKMPESEINEKVNELLAQSGDYESEINMLIKAMLDYDEQSFNDTYSRIIEKGGLLNSMIKIIYPFLKRTGVLWGINKVMPAQEHFISNLIRQKIISSIGNLSSPKRNAPKMLMFLPETEMHEISLLLASYIAKKSGWNIVYLGQNVPYDNVKTILRDIKFKAIVSMLVTPMNEKSVKQFSDFISDVSIPIIISGSENNLRNFNGINGVSIVYSPTDLVKYIKQNN